MREDIKLRRIVVEHHLLQRGVGAGAEIKPRRHAQYQQQYDNNSNRFFHNDSSMCDRLASDVSEMFNQ